MERIVRNRILIFLVVAAILSLIYLWYTLRFARIARNPAAPESRTYARDLLKASVIYLPLLMAAMSSVPWAKLTTRIVPNTMFGPSAMRA